MPVWVEYVAFILSIICFFLANTLGDFLGSFVYIIDMFLCALDLYVLSISKGFNSRFFAKKTMVYLGNLSMYIFLTHWLILKYLDSMINCLNLQSPLTGILEIFIIWIFSLLVAIILYNDNQKRQPKKGESRH